MYLPVFRWNIFVARLPHAGQTRGDVTFLGGRRVVGGTVTIWSEGSRGA
jgi:hypothetical protein